MPKKTIERVALEEIGKWVTSLVLCNHCPRYDGIGGCAKEGCAKAFVNHFLAKAKAMKGKSSSK